MKKVNLYSLWFTIFINISLLGNKKTDVNNGCEQKITFDVIIFTNRLFVHETNNEHNHTENSQRFRQFSGAPGPGRICVKRSQKAP